MKTSHVLGAAQAVKNPKSIWKLIKAILRREYTPKFATFLYFILLLLYVVFPADVLPDFIPVIGWIDDGVLLLWFLRRLNKEAEWYAQKTESEVNSTVFKK